MLNDARPSLLNKVGLALEFKKWNCATAASECTCEAEHEALAKVVLRSSSQVCRSRPASSPARTSSETFGSSLAAPEAATASSFAFSCAAQMTSTVTLLQTRSYLGAVGTLPSWRLLFVEM